MEYAINELKGINKLNNTIEAMFKALGYSEIKCTFGLDFCYYYDGSNEIEYSLISMPEVDEAFKEYIQNKFTNIPYCSMFTFSLLHELGHHITMPQISKKELKKARKAKKRIENKIKNNPTPKKLKEMQIKYCSLIDEKLATNKAMEILKKYYFTIDKYDKMIYNNIIEFYKINNVE